MLYARKVVQFRRRTGVAITDRSEQSVAGFHLERCITVRGKSMKNEKDIHSLYVADPVIVDEILWGSRTNLGNDRDVLRLTWLDSGLVMRPD